MDSIVIRVEASEKGIQDLAKQLNELKDANSKLEKEVSANHSKQKQRDNENDDGVKKHMGLIENLEHRIKQLTEIRNKTFDPEVIHKSNKALEEANKRHQELTKTNEKELDWNTKLSRSFKDLGEGIIAAFAVEKLIEFGKESVVVYAEAQEAAQKLKFAITQVNGEGEKSFEILNEQAEKLEKNLNKLYDKKQIQGSQTQLANYGLTSRMIEKLTPQILDVAAATGKSLDEVTQKFLLAVNGQTKGLRDIGVQFKDTGSKTENFNKLLEQTSKFSGAAMEKSKELSGQLAEAKNYWEDAQEATGKFLVTGTNVAKFMGDMAVGFIHQVLSLGGAFDKTYESVKLTNEQLELLEKTFSKGNIAKMQLDIARANGVEGIALTKATEQAKLAIEASYTEEIEKLNKTQIQGEIQKLEKIKDNRFQIVKEEDLTNKRRIEMLKDLLSTMSKINEDDTALGEEKKKAAYEKMLKMQEEYDKLLLEIKKKNYEDGEKYALSQIKDELNRMLAAEEMGTEKLYAELMERRDKLSEIQNSPLSRKDQKETATSEQKELNGVIEDLERDHQEKLLKIQTDYQEKQKKIFQDEEAKKIQEEQKKNKEEMDYLLEQNSYQSDLEKIELKKRLADKKITQEDYDKESNDIDLQTMEDRLKIEHDHGVEDLKLQTDIENKKLDIQLKSANKQKEILNDLKEIATQIFEGLAENIQNNINAIDGQMERQNRMIDEQKILAEKGLQNDLAFEEKRADELTKKKLEEEKKLKNIKELEVFLNSVATYTQEGNNPAEAVGKALGILAATKAAEAVYAEEGGILGQTKERSYIGLGGMSRRHRSGGDILLHAQRGEGIIPKNTMENWGLTDNSKFNQFLKNPFNEKLISGSPKVIIQDNSEVVKRLESLEETIRNKTETQINWDEYGQMIKTEVKNGITKYTKELNLSARKRL